ncbi:MAG: FAD:protein FMN transferase [Planctomycetota bacterium]
MKSRWFFLVLVLCGCQGPFKQDALKKAEFEHAAMGTQFRIVAYHSDRQKLEDAVILAMEKIDRIENICSDWKSDSEIRQLCRSSPSQQPMAASPELIEILSRAIEISRASEGAFDPTLGPMMRLWRRCQAAGRLPRPEELAEARKAQGIENIVIDVDARTVQLLSDGMAIDLGGIAKGYAVDAALKVLEFHGIQHALVDGGGDIALGNPPADREGWQLWLQPAGSDDETTSKIQVVIADRGAVATSGDASRFIELAGQRYSHILDPETGLGIKGPHAVTVYAADGTTADALATAISVIPIEKSDDLLKRFPGSSAIIFDLTPAPPLILGSFPGYHR